MPAADDALIPIDIHYNKLLEWLISRRHCSKSWQADAVVIREKINAAISDMPENEELTVLLSGTYINYFHCLRIVELLKETESSTKNIFGRYSSKRMKDWQEIVNLYEKDGIYLADSAQLLMRNVNYEISSLKKQIARCKQAHQDAVRKESENAALSAQTKEKYVLACKKLGIPGQKVRSELLALVKDMPAFYDEIVKDSKTLNKPISYYKDFIEFTLESSKFGNECVPMLKHVLENGNTTVYEWKYKHKPDQIVEPDMNYGQDNINTDNNEGDSEEAEIDWGADEIDFDISTDPQPDSSKGDEESASIDWGGIEVEHDDSALSNVDSNIARGDEARSVLDFVDTRNQFLDELMELESFLVQASTESKSSGSDVLSSSRMSSAPSSLQIETEHIDSMLADVRCILAKLTDVNTQELLIIRSFPRYVDRMTSKLEKTRADAERQLSISRLCHKKQGEMIDEQAEIQPRIDALRVKTKRLQKQIEGEISKKYSNRRVNIMGEINTI